MNKISLIAMHTIEFNKNIDNLQSMKERTMVKWNWRKSRIILPGENEHLVYLYIFYLFSKSHYGDKYSKTTTARNLKFGQMIGLYMNLSPPNFE